MSEQTTKTIQQLDAEADAQIVAIVGKNKYTRKQLRKAFDRVANRSNWKLAIDWSVSIRTHRERLAILEAVKFFAGCEASAEIVELIPDHARGGSIAITRFRAVGYYAAVGA